MFVEREDYGVLDEEWRQLVVGVDVGLDEDEDAVVIRKRDAPPPRSVTELMRIGLS